MDLLDQVRKNLEAKLAAGDIKSVPDLDDKTKKKYRHGNERGSPKAAYCDDQTYVKNGTGEDKCDPKDILVDGDILDPGGGTPIDPSTMEGWQQKWTLVHILVHEKMHEIMIEAQLDELTKQPGWAAKTPAQQAKLIEEAKRKAASPETHAQVYNWQKNVLRLYKKVLQKELKELRKDRRANADAIAEVKAKIDWLRKEVRRLETAKRNAIAGHSFGFQGCGWPQGLTGGTLALYVTFPGGYWVLGVAVQDGVAVDYRIARTAFLDAVEEEDVLPGPPSLHVVMSETTFSGMHIQPEACAYVDWATETGRIAAYEDPAVLKDLLPQPIAFALTDGVTGEPLAGVTVDLFASNGSHVQRVVTNETGAFSTLLPPDAYDVRVSLKVLGFDVGVSTREAVDPRVTDEVAIVVSAVVVPLAVVPLLVHLLLALVLGLAAGFLSHRFGRERLPRWGPYALAGGVAGVALLPLAFG
jgi:hypothetical protein